VYSVMLAKYQICLFKDSSRIQQTSTVLILFVRKWYKNKLLLLLANSMQMKQLCGCSVLQERALCKRHAASGYANFKR
jgi:hypothetical protein